MVNKKWRESIFFKMNPPNKKMIQKSVIQQFLVSKCKFRAKHKKAKAKYFHKMKFKQKLSRQMKKQQKN